MTKKILLAAGATLLLSCGAAGAADWSDTSISWRYGTRFAEPFNPEHIKKHIFALTHASGYKYGSNYFNVDLLQSDSSDPGSLNQRAGERSALLVDGVDVGGDTVRLVDDGQAHRVELHVAPRHGASILAPPVEPHSKTIT